MNNGILSKIQTYLVENNWQAVKKELDQYFNEQILESKKITETTESILKFLLLLGAPHNRKFYSELNFKPSDLENLGVCIQQTSSNFNAVYDIFYNKNKTLPFFAGLSDDKRDEFVLKVLRSNDSDLMKLPDEILLDVMNSLKTLPDRRYLSLEADKAVGIAIQAFRDYYPREFSKVATKDKQRLLRHSLYQRFGNKSFTEGDRALLYTAFAKIASEDKYLSKPNVEAALDSFVNAQQNMQKVIKAVSEKLDEKIKSNLAKYHNKMVFDQHDYILNSLEQAYLYQTMASALNRIFDINWNEKLVDTFAQQISAVIFDRLKDQTINSEDAYKNINRFLNITELDVAKAFIKANGKETVSPGQKIEVNTPQNHAILQLPTSLKSQQDICDLNYIREFVKHNNWLAIKRELLKTFNVDQVIKYFLLLNCPPHKNFFEKLKFKESELQDFNYHVEQMNRNFQRVFDLFYDKDEPIPFFEGFPSQQGYKEFLAINILKENDSDLKNFPDELLLETLNEMQSLPRCKLDKPVEVEKSAILAVQKFRDYYPKEISKETTLDKQNLLNDVLALHFGSKKLTAAERALLGAELIQLAKDEKYLTRPNLEHAVNSVIEMKQNILAVIRKVSSNKNLLLNELKQKDLYETMAQVLAAHPKMEWDEKFITPFTTRLITLLIEKSSKPLSEVAAINGKHLDVNENEIAEILLGIGEVKQNEKNSNLENKFYYSRGQSLTKNNVSLFHLFTNLSTEEKEEKSAAYKNTFSH